MLHRFGLSKMTRQIVAFVLIPILFSLGSLIKEIHKVYVDEYIPAKDLLSFVETANYTAILVHNLAVERGLSSLFIAENKDSKVYSKMLKQREKVNKSLSKLPLSKITGEIISKIKTLRQKVENGEFSSPTQVLRAYTNVIDEIINAFIDKPLKKEFLMTKFQAPILSLRAFILLKDRTGIERALASNITAFSQEGKVPPELLAWFSEILGEKKLNKNIFILVSSPKILKEFSILKESTNSHKVEEIENAINSGNFTYLTANYSPLQVFSIYTSFLKDLKQIQERTISKLQEISKIKFKEAKVNLLINLANCLSLIFSIIVLTILRNKLVNSLNSIKGVLQEIEKGNLHLNLNPEGNDEFAEMEKSISSLVSTFNEVIQQTTQITEKIANGTIDGVVLNKKNV